MINPPDWGGTVEAVADAFAGIDDAGWGRPSACTDWTVRQAANHLAGGLTLLTAIAEGTGFEPDSLRPEFLAGSERLGAEPAKTIGELGRRAQDVLSRADVLSSSYEFPRPQTPGVMLANLAVMELVVHGWDIATGAGVAYRPDPAAVASLVPFTALVVDDSQRGGRFGAAVATAPDADAFTRLLGHLGRRGMAG